ncbi:hypothetical protein Tco_0685890 [Tanacetum coccineum]
MFQTLQVQVTKLKSENEDLKLSIEEFTKAREIVEATLRERDEMVSAQCEKIRLLEEQSELFYGTQSDSTLETKNLELVKEMRDKMKWFDDEKKVFETKISKLEKFLAQRAKDFDDFKTEL